MKSISIKDSIKFKPKSTEKNKKNLTTHTLPPRSNSKPKASNQTRKISPITNLYSKKPNNIPKPPKSKIKNELENFSQTLNFKRNYAQLFESLTIKNNKRIANSIDSKPKDLKYRNSHNVLNKNSLNKRKERPTKSPVSINKEILSSKVVDSSSHGKLIKYNKNANQSIYHRLCRNKSKDKINPISLLNSHLIFNVSKIKRPKSKSPVLDKGKMINNVKIKNKKFVNDGLHLFFNKLHQLQSASHSRSTSANTTVRLNSNNNRNNKKNLMHKLKSITNLHKKKQDGTQSFVKFNSPHPKLTTKNINVSLNSKEFCNSDCPNSPERSIHEYNNNSDNEHFNQYKHYNVPSDTICSQEEITVPKISKVIKQIYEFSVVGYDGEKNKVNNQDSYFISKNFLQNTIYIYFGICDGHGVEGHLVSKYICETIPLEMSERLRYVQLESENIDDKHKYSSEILHKIITNAFLTSNKKLIYQDQINSLFSGTTCVSVIYTPSKLITAHLGDSRAILGRFEHTNNKWTSIVLTRDHKPTEIDEMERILQKEGRIQPFYEEGEPYGPMRVWVKNEEYPGLAMTRSFGDRMAATVGVISEPEIKEFNLTEEDKFLIIASDGIWEFISNEECVNFVKEYYIKGDGNECINKLYELSKKRWLREEEVVDDTTVILVFFE